MKTIINIYDEYGIPNNLRLHMLRVAGIGKYILENWSGPKIDEASLLKVLLLHDMGNIVKMDEDVFLDKYSKTLRAQYLSKYGNNDHLLSHDIGKGLGLTNEELKLMDDKIFIKNDETIKSEDYARKIGAYADQRAAPDGVYPILKRLREAQQRYKNKPGSSMNSPRTEYLIECALQLEKQIFYYCKIDPTNITNDRINLYIDKLKDYKI